MIKRRRIYTTISLAIVLFIMVAPGASHFRSVVADDGNLLLNGNFEGAFLEYPKGGGGKDYVAEKWSRWWIHGTSIPEFSDAVWGRKPYDGDHAQIYHSWPDYTAGVYQIITDVTACRPYQLTMYTKTHAAKETVPHSRIGLDPEGNTFTDDGAVKNGLPSKTVWSEEQEDLEVWEELSVKAEPTGESLTVILYAAPRPNPFYETYWDKGKLVPASYSNGRLPEPNGTVSDFIYDVTVITNTHSITISWHTAEPPAATQVWYDVFTPSTPSSPTITNTTYLPLVVAVSQSEDSFDETTGISFMRATEHQALINGLRAGQGVRFIILARRLNGDTCETVRSKTWIVETEASIPR